MKPEYLAGFFDGEGCIDLPVSGNGSVYARLSVVNTHYEVILEIQNAFGGMLSVKRGGRENHKGYYCLMWNSGDAEKLLVILTPHLIVKKRQAELALQLIRSKKGRKRRDFASKERDHGLRIAMRELNRRGLKLV